MTNKSKLDSVQILRGFAALGVVLSHSHSRYLRSFPEDIDTSVFHAIGNLKWIGHVGVDLFFVISGFIMVLVHFNDFEKQGASKNFALKRIKRIVPIYWILSFLALGILILRPDLFYYNRTLDIEWLVSSFLFFPLRSDSGITTPLIGVGWTLNYEMYFYLVFAVLLLFPRRVFLPAISAYFCLSVAVGYLLKPTNLFLIMATNWLLLEFLVGCFLGFLYRKDIRMPFGPAVLCIVGAFGIWTVWVITGADGGLGGFPRFIWWGVPAAILLAGIVMCPQISDRLHSKALVVFGDSSYSLYLTHTFTLPAVAIAMKWTGLVPYIPPDISMLLMTLACCVTAYFFYLLVESPITRFLSRKKGQ